MGDLAKSIEGYETAIAVVALTTLVIVAANFVLGGKKRQPVALDPKKEIEFELIKREDLSPDTRMCVHVF